MLYHESSLTNSQNAGHNVNSYMIGSILMMSPSLLHIDEEVYPDPKRFKFDRFVGDPKFYKAGQHVKTPLLPFGGGMIE